MGLTGEHLLGNIRREYEKKIKEMDKVLKAKDKELEEIDKALEEKDKLIQTLQEESKGLRALANTDPD